MAKKLPRPNELRLQARRHREKALGEADFQRRRARLVLAAEYERLADVVDAEECGSAPDPAEAARTAARRDVGRTTPSEVQNLRPPRVLIVEDEMLIAMMLKDQVTRLGYRVIGPASRVERAVRLIENEEIEAALLDVNVAGEKVDPVAQELRHRGIPFAFVSGYASWIAKDFADRPCVAKPIQVHQLARALRHVLDEAAA